MKIHEPGLYHIYNRGNNRQQVFYSRDHYAYFLKKCHKYIKPFGDILAWCLMTNHFHFLLEVAAKGFEPVKCGSIFMPAITNGFRLLQSSYAKAINCQMNRTGNLFQQKTKAKLVNLEEKQAITTFHYIHQTPVRAGIVSLPEQWEYSSFRDYLGLRKGTLCNKHRASQLLEIPGFGLETETSKVIEQEKIVQIYLPEDMSSILEKHRAG